MLPYVANNAVNHNKKSKRWFPNFVCKPSFDDIDNLVSPPPPTAADPTHPKWFILNLFWINNILL